MVELDGVMTEVDNRSVKLYSREHSIELNDWTDAYKCSFKNTKFKNNETQLFFCSGNSHIIINNQFCTEYFDFLETLNT